MFDCQDFRMALRAFVAGELSPELREVAEEHLDVCDACAAGLEAYWRTIRAGWQPPQLPPPPRLLKRFLDAVNQEERR